MIAALLLAASMTMAHPYQGASLPDTFRLTDSIGSPTPLTMTWDVASLSWISPGGLYQLKDGDGLRVLGYGGDTMWFNPTIGAGLPITFTGSIPTAGPIMTYYGVSLQLVGPWPRPVISLIP